MEPNVLLVVGSILAIVLAGVIGLLVRAWLNRRRRQEAERVLLEESERERERNARKLREGVAAKYAADMRAGNWKVRSSRDKLPVKRPVEEDQRKEDDTLTDVVLGAVLLNQFNREPMHVDPPFTGGGGMSGGAGASSSWDEPRKEPDTADTSVGLMASPSSQEEQKTDNSDFGSCKPDDSSSSSESSSSSDSSS